MTLSIFSCAYLPSIYLHWWKVCSNSFLLLVFSLLGFLIFFKFILAVLGIRCCTGFLSTCNEQGPPFVEVLGFLIAMASPLVEHRLQGVQTSVVVVNGSSPSTAWDLPRPGIKPVSPALVDSTTEPTGKPHWWVLKVPYILGTHTLH